MSRESTGQTLRGIGSLYTVGSVGALTDRQLVERFLDTTGSDRDDAFAAIVARHGAMVLGVCRRMLGESGDEEDAFQAVFLVLARKAPSLRGAEGLRSWLYTVTVKTAQESRRRVARQRARDAMASERPKPVPVEDPGQTELRALVDEEISRLPRRFRDPILLCELEGASRQAAAHQLGVPEGTLSSRLSRGRSLLRDRLTRRGISLGAGLSAALGSANSQAALPEPLAQVTIRAALKFVGDGAATGAVPAGVASLAESVLAMGSVARLKLIVVGAVAMAATACLTTGLVMALGHAPSAADGQVGPTAEIAGATAAAEPAEVPSRTEARGIVVDEAGRPVAGIEVMADAFSNHESNGVTGKDGSFAIALNRQRVAGTRLLARSSDRSRVGHFQFDSDATRAAGQVPARVVIKPAKPVVVRVSDGAGRAVPHAIVEAAAMHGGLDDARTGPDGSATLRIPVDARVVWIVALKHGRGFDYAEYGRFDEAGRARDGAPASELPGTVPLTLDRPRTAQIKAVDGAGAPVAGTTFYVWLLSKEGKRSEVNFATRILSATTGPDGVATFDWLPPSNRGLIFWPVDRQYAHRRVSIEDGQVGPAVTTLVRNVTIRGRVVNADRSPAAGVEVHALGSGHEHDQGRAETVSAADGSYTLDVPPNEGYAVFVEHPEWAAPSRLDVIVREGKPVDGVDFRLSRGTMLRGTVTVGAARRPVANQYIYVDEAGKNAPEEFRVKGDTVAHGIGRLLGVRTGQDGRYAIRIGPGNYTLVGPARTSRVNLVVKAEPELVNNFEMPRPEKGPIAGRVVLAEAREKGVAGARVEINAANLLSVPVAVTTDADGRFQVQRDLDPLVVWAASADRKLAGIVEAGAEDPEIVIPIAATATASGVLLDDDGKPAANAKLTWGRRIYLDGERTISRICFAPKVTTDAGGRFHLPALVVGQEYEISLRKETHFLPAGAVRAESAGHIDLGRLRAGAYRLPSAGGDDELSSFRKDAPDAGAVAPAIVATTLDGKPLELADFRGKYVLLDFWATWCGPCLGEIPKLQGVHDAFARDDRLAILSVSVDEAIDAPRKFQEERKLPWNQAFIGEGIHGPTPSKFGIRAIPAFVLVGPDGRIVARGMRGDEIKKAVERALAKKP